MAIYLSDHFLVAGDPAQSPDVLRDVYQNAPPDVRRRLAENPSSPEELLFRLSKDSDPEVRASLAYNKVVPLEILEALAGDEDVNVRLALAEEFELPPYILQKLCEDQNPYVRDRRTPFRESVEERRFHSTSRYKCSPRRSSSRCQRSHNRITGRSAESSN